MLTANQKRTLRKKAFALKHNIGFGFISRYGQANSLAVFTRANWHCEKCDTTKDLTFHHIDGNGSNLRGTGKSPNNKPENIMLVCRSCPANLDAWKAAGKHVKRFGQENPFYGKTHDETTKERMRRAKGNFTGKNKEKIQAKSSRGKAGYRLSLEHKNNISLGLTGKPKSEESKRKARATMLKHWSDKRRAV